ncbi:MAG: ABC transporter substrate-binding protein [bacterium]|nr:ABC transporter substrate-binding protein [bacterium]MCM1374345.1 ABC transporter substrate-binding protein [Muribaculum sp.]
MVEKRQRNLQSRIVAMAILIFALLLAGCGRGTAESEEASVEGTKQSPEQTVSADTEESATESESGTSDREEIASGLFQYDYIKLHGDMQALPVIREEQAIEEGRTVLTLQTSWVNAWLKDSIAGFNRQSADYFIKISQTYEDDDIDRLSVELLAGKGPDILSSEIFEINENILKKGILLDLAPGLDAMGITDEQYFPSVRALRAGDGVYGISPCAEPEGFWIRESVLGSKEATDIETLVEKLYTYPDQDAVWWTGAKPEFILEYLLEGSEDLWGIIDWEKGTCDFSGELFARILEVAKRYADPERKGNNEKDIAFYYNPTYYSHEQMDSEGKAIVNFLFDDGNYPKYRTGLSVFMLNANSPNQEGVWAFLEYLLSEEGQGYAADGSGMAANRSMARSYAAYELQLLEEGRMETSGNITPEAYEELFDYADQARYASLRTREILAIIYEEAQDYCNGEKPLKNVCDVIQSRAQIVISENL